MPNNFKHISNYTLIAIVAVSIMLQVMAAAQMSFWEDEVFTANFTESGQDAQAKVIEWDVHPPLYLYLADYWGKIFGYEELGLRFLSILFSELTLFLTYLLAVSLMGNTVGLASTALLAFSPLFIMFGHQARYYSMTAFLSVAVVYFMWRYLERGKWPYFVFYILLSILLCYVLFAGMVVVAVCAGWGLFDRWRGFHRTKERVWILDGLLWFLAQCIILAAYLPGLMGFNSLLSRSTEITRVSNWLVELSKRLAYVAYVFGIGETVSPLNPVAWIGWIALFCIGGYAILPAPQKDRFLAADNYYHFCYPCRLIDEHPDIRVYDLAKPASQDALCFTIPVDLDRFRLSKLETQLEEICGFVYYLRLWYWDIQLFYR